MRLDATQRPCRYAPSANTPICTVYRHVWNDLPLKIEGMAQIRWTEKDRVSSAQCGTTGSDGVSVAVTRRNCLKAEAGMSHPGPKCLITVAGSADQKAPRRRDQHTFDLTPEQGPAPSHRITGLRSLQTAADTSLLSRICCPHNLWLIGQPSGAVRSTVINV